MPLKAYRVCKAPGCRKATKSKYCDGCKLTKPKPKSKTDHYSQQRWIKKRDAWLAEHPLCQCTNSECTEHPPGECRRNRPQVDHIIPLADGGADDASNFQTLCVWCHSRKTAQDTGFGARKKERTHVDAE